MNEKRVRRLNDLNPRGTKVLYWMSRDQRVQDNWALLYAQELGSDVSVIFNFSDFPMANERSMDFMIEGLKEVEIELRSLGIPFFVTSGEPKEILPEFIKKYGFDFLVTDFSPLKVSRKWKNEVNTEIVRLGIPYFEVDSHNIVPAFYVSKKKEFGAYTLRPKIHRLLDEFMEEFPDVRMGSGASYPIAWDKIIPKYDTSVKKVDWLRPGYSEGMKILKVFLYEKLENYNLYRNSPNLDGISNLSPYLHFGQISAQRVALEVVKSDNPSEAKDVFLEELVVRRELADNFCLYEENYDLFDGFPRWAKETLNEHRDDIREYLYSLNEFEEAITHDDLWNASQKELLRKGKMHGYLRMYWAKKILEWSTSPEEALKTAIYLNDKYSLDGRDPNGYTGIAWCIGGVHDRAWFSRPIFGKIRFMALSGMKKKFDVKEYITYNT